VGGDLYESAAGSYQTVYLGGRGLTSGLLWNLEGRIWNTPTEEIEGAVELTLSIPVGDGFTLEVAGGRAGPDPLLDTPPGVNGSALLSWEVLGPPRPPEPVYRVGQEPTGTFVTFRLEREDATEVAVIGDFSGWEPVPLQERGGVWRARIPIAPGVYHFGFLVDGEWHVPDHAPGRVTDEFGRDNATLVVQVTPDGR
jgi:hypothetical protein